MASTPQKEPRLACSVCRSRKVACDRQRPRCGLCAKNDFDCQYKSRQHRPGLKAGYVSQLERQLEDVQDRLRKIENHLEKSSPAFSGEALVSTPLHLEQGEPIQVDDSITVSEANEQDTSPTGSYVGGATPLPSRTMHWQDLTSQESLLYPVASICVREWFHKCHPWFPILHQLSLHDISEHTLPRYTLVWKAITVVVASNQADDALLPHEIISRLQDQVFLRALATSSLQSIQALLILCSVFFASGNLAQCWNVIAVCKRSFLHPHMRAYFEDPASVNQPTTPLPRSPILIDSVEQEEAIRSFWMTEMLDSILTIGLPDQYTHGDPPLSIRLPCMESLWSSGAVLQEQPASPRPQYSSGFSLCIMLAVEELRVVRTFLKKPYELSRLEQRLDWQSEAQRIDERLTNWREEFVANVFQLINYEKEYVPRGEMEPFFTLTNCLLNIALITLLQQMAPLPKEVDREHEPWSFATTRCVYACENLTAKVRRIEANQLLDESPYLILCVFVAARFYITYSKALDADVPANLHTLAFVLHTCGRKWPLSSMCEVIIRTAVAEHRSPISQCVLPIEFYDSRYPTLAIMDLLQNAAKGLNLP